MKMLEILTDIAEEQEFGVATDKTLRCEKRVRHETSRVQIPSQWVTSYSRKLVSQLLYLVRVGTNGDNTNSD